MLESTFLEDWDEIGTKMAKKGHFLPKSGINSELVSIQRVKNRYYYFHNPHKVKEEGFFSQISTLKAIPSDNKSILRHLFKTMSNAL